VFSELRSRFRDELLFFPVGFGVLGEKGALLDTG